jgi:hypothetical protein
MMMNLLTQKILSQQELQVAYGEFQTSTSPQANFAAILKQAKLLHVEVKIEDMMQVFLNSANALNVR